MVKSISNGEFSFTRLIFGGETCIQGLIQILLFFLDCNLSWFWLSLLNWVKLNIEKYISFRIRVSWELGLKPTPSIRPHTKPQTQPKNTVLKFSAKQYPYSPTFTMSSQKAISRRKLLKLQDKREAFDRTMQEINLKMLQYEFDLLS